MDVILDPFNLQRGDCSLRQRVPFPWQVLLVGIVYYLACSTILLSLIESYIRNPSLEFQQNPPSFGECDAVKYDFAQYIEGAKFDFLQSYVISPAHVIITLLLLTLHVSAVLNRHWKLRPRWVFSLDNVNSVVAKALALLTILSAVYANHVVERMKYDCNMNCPYECGCLNLTAHGACALGTIWVVGPLGQVPTVPSVLHHYMSIVLLIWAIIEGPSSVVSRIVGGKRFNQMVNRIVGHHTVQAWRVTVKNKEFVEKCFMHLAIPKGVTITQIDPNDGSAPRTRPNRHSTFKLGDVVYMSCAGVAQAREIDEAKESESWKYAKRLGSLDQESMSRASSGIQQESDPEMVILKCKEVGGKVPESSHKKILGGQLNLDRIPEKRRQEEGIVGCVDLRVNTNNLTVCGIVKTGEEVIWFPTPETVLCKNDRLLIVDEVDENETFRCIWSRIK